jgi:hypothetical protein
MKGQGHYAFVCFQVQGTQGNVLVSHAFKQIYTLWPCPSPIQKELVKFFLCEFRLIFRHNCVEDFTTCVRSRSTIDKTTVIYSVGQVSVFLETRWVRVLEAFLMLNPVLFLLFSFLQQTQRGFQKIEKTNFPLFQIAGSQTVHMSRFSKMVLRQRV